MKTATSMIGAAVALVGAAAAYGAVPVVTSATMTQPSNSREVTITYQFTGGPAVITLDVQTNYTENAETKWASIGGEAVWNATGEVWKKVEGDATNHVIKWRPDLSWPNHQIEDGGARAVVTAYALDNTPDYMVVDLAIPATGDNIAYYPGAEYLPKASYAQEGAAVTNNPAYKTTKLVMRKIMAAGVPWTMGSASVETGRHTADTRETAHPVTLTNNYYMGIFPITQKQWMMVATNDLANAASETTGDTKPMTNIQYVHIRMTHNESNAAWNSIKTWDYPVAPNPVSYIGQLNLLSGLDFELPGEAQWEFACRAGNINGSWGDGTAITNATADANLANLGAYKANANALTDVGTCAPNSWGLYDMHGNVREYCLDWFNTDITENGGVVVTTNAGTGNTGVNARVVRGGSYSDNAQYCRPASRIYQNHKSGNNITGFRVVCRAGLQ